MSDNSKTTEGGAGFATLLLIAFIVLKLCNVIHWSWWWVLSPFWIPLVFIGVCLLIVFILEARHEKRKPKLRKVEKSTWEIRLEEMQAKQKAANK